LLPKGIYFSLSLEYVTAIESLRRIHSLLYQIACPPQPVIHPRQNPHRSRKAGNEQAPTKEDEQTFKGPKESEQREEITTQVKPGK